LALKGYKWRVLVKTYSVDFPLLKAISYWLIGFVIGIITPGRMGDMARSYYLKGRLPLGKALTTVIVDRVLDVFVLFFLSIFGIISFITLYTFEFTYSPFLLLFSVILPGFIIMLYILSRKEFVVRLVRPFFKRIVSEKYKKGATKIFHDFYSGLNILKKKKTSVIYSFLVAIFSWLLIFFQTYVLSLSLNVGLSLVFIASILPVITLLDILPISFSGIGTRDAAMIFFFSFISLSAETAVFFSLLILVFNYFISATIGFILWVKNPIKLDYLKNET
jgi:uncharacterized protein (TIRG00374 family)